MGVLVELRASREALDQINRMLQLIEYRLAIPGARGLLKEEVTALREAVDTPGKLAETLDRCTRVQERLEGVRK